MTIDSVTLSAITKEISDMFPEMSQDNVDCITKYMGKHENLWDKSNIPAGVKKCLPLALVQKDHTSYLLLGIIITMFINMFLNVVLYLATNIYNIPFRNKNLDAAIM